MEPENTEGDGANLADDSAIETPEGAQEPSNDDAQEPKKHEPPVDSPRWNEIYGKLKHSERTIDELKTTMEGMAEHNKKLYETVTKVTESVDKVSNKVFESEMPDPLQDPQGYKEWVKQDVLRSLPKVEPPPVAKKVDTPDRLQYLEDIQRAVHDDYDEVSQVTIEQMKKDPVLRSEIYNAKDPAKAAYKHGLTVMQRRAQADQSNRNKAHVEGGTPPPDTPKGTLTAQEKAIAKALRISEKDYLEQKLYIGR